MFEIYDPYLVNNVKYLVKPINFCQQQSVITKTKICVYFRKKKKTPYHQVISKLLANKLKIINIQLFSSLHKRFSTPKYAFIYARTFS